jgi:hypothetical protein
MQPREFGKYRIVKLLPLGGMGRVYLAIDPQTQQKVALKLIDQGPDPDRIEIVEAERRGAILQARLCGLDDRITRILGYGDHDGFFFIEMEYVEGQDLAELLAAAPLGVPFAARIGRDILDVLHHAHTFSAEIEGHQYHGIVHGDIKPRNIRITPDGQVKVLDFGIAKALSLTRKFTTNQFGSSQYSSPERLNTGDVDVTSDLWSVGVVLFEIVTGKPYFSSESSGRLEHQIRNYSEVRSLPESMPAPFRAIVRKALRVDPAAVMLPPSPFASDLNNFLNDKPVAAESEPEIDDEATRRLNVRAAAAAEADEAATRRTTGPAESAAVPFPGVPVGGRMPSAAPARPVPFNRKPKTPLTPKQRQIRFFATLAVLLLVGLVVFNEVTGLAERVATAQEVRSERLTDMSAAWDRYETLQKTSFVPWVLSPPRNAIHTRLTAVADSVINEYRRSDAPNVKEAQWIGAQTALTKAFQMDPNDKAVRGKLYLCEGHLARIRGDARGLSKMLQEARAKFEQSADLLPRSPDPYLGLARLYVYSLHDVERAEDALKAAEKRGHNMGRRERAQLADGYRDRGERLMRDAVKAAGLPEESELLKRAEKDLHRAEDLYRDIIPYGGSGTGLRRVLENLDVVAARRDAMKDSIWPWK